MSRMVEVKVAELSGDLLDCLVATIENPAEKIFHNCDGYTLRWHNKPPAFSTDWSQGGPLIDTYKVKLTPDVLHEASLVWRAFAAGYPFPSIGGSALTAACRAIVAAKLGPVVSVPAELVQGVSDEH